MNKKNVLLAFLFLFLFASSLFAAGVIQLPQTGQTKCHNSSGVEIPCAGTGQDGEIRAGVAWPTTGNTPSGRFNDNGDGTITDLLTGLIWAKDAGTPTVSSCTGGAKTWQGALDYVACLNANGYLGYSDWMLPNVNELESLINTDETVQATWLNTQGFANVQVGLYGSSTIHSYYTFGAAWRIDMWWRSVEL